MATTRIMPLHIGKGRTESRAISDIIDYVANPQKTDNGKLITGYGCDSRTADAEFLLAKRQYIAATGRVRGADDVIAYHVRQSFKPGEITPEEANRLGVEFAKRFTKGNHAFVVCTHIDKSHVHNHIIWSAVNADCDRKFRNFWGSTKAVRRLSDTICIENGLSIVENPKLHGKSYNKWLGDQAKPSHRELLRVAIDNALSQSPADFEELLKLLQEYGCEVSKRGKSYRLKLSVWEKAARMDSLGEGYGLEDLRAVLLGKKAHTPRKKTVTQAEPPKVNLLVDIQAKLQAGKGAGYARWAKVFNLKQMAQTMNYLSENNLLEYAVLEEKATAATAHHNDLSAQIKAAEKRMAEIAVLRTHIVNYAKTREVYVAYRKAGYSKKFREEHEEEILLHQAAKNAFDEMQSAKVSASTLRGYTRDMTNYIIKPLGEMYMEEVTADDIRLALVPLSKKSEGLYNKVNMLLKCIFYAAERNQILEHNPCAGISGKGGKPTKKKEALTDQQVAVLLDTVKGLPPYLFIMLGLYSGLRREEILALQWDCVFLDEDTPYLSVRRAWRTEHNRPVVSTVLKTPAAKRDIPIPKCLVDCLRETKENSISDYVIADSKGEPLAASQFQRVWQYVVVRSTKPRNYYKYVNGESIKYTVTPTLGMTQKNQPQIKYTLDFDVTPHQLRHTYITNLLYAGVDPKTVQYLAGHENSKTTMDIYAKVKYNKPEELFGVVNGAFHQAIAE